MKQRLFLPLFYILWILNIASAQKSLTILQLNQVLLDSLLKMDTLQASANFSLDETDPVKANDTVSIVGIVVVRPRIITFTLARYSVFIQDTVTGQLWGGLFVLTNDTSSKAQSTLISTVDTGMIIKVVGRALEFGNQPNSVTEISLYSTTAPVFTSPVAVEILAVKPTRPAPIEVTVDSFAVGKIPRPSGGEKYEGMYVIIRNVMVNSVDSVTGRFTFVDTNGNQMTMFDGSGYYTLRGHKFFDSKYTPPPVGTKLDYIRGVICPQPVPLTPTAGEYKIFPLYPGPEQVAGSTYPGDIMVDKSSAVKSDATILGGFKLLQNYPNPFNPSTIISYGVKEEGIVSVKVFNSLGQEIATLVNGKKGVGYYYTEWNAAGHPSGMYFYRFIAGEYSETKKMILMK
ncbi:MAG: T9SS type A sorting domain-containing protein [Bacteroidetes bacterium]|nr:T9SS type A sorting domain-containing protein [Bacteroidota bacterium]